MRADYLGPVLALALGLMAFVRFWRVGNIPLRNDKLEYLVYPVSQMLLVIFMAVAGAMIDAGDAYWAVLIACGLISAFASPMLLRMLLRARQRDIMRERSRILDEQLGHQREHLRLAQREEESIRSSYEVVGAAYQAVWTSLEAGDVSEASAELGRLEASPLLLAPRIRTGHVALDALLMVKARACQERGVRFEVEVTLPDGFHMDDVDLCAMVSNLLDNALNACERLPHDARWITVSIDVVAGILVVQVRNSYEAEEHIPTSEIDAPLGCHVNMRENQEVGADTAPRAIVREHGWGLKIVDMIARRHGGELSCEQAEGEWASIITMPMML